MQRATPILCLTIVSLALSGMALWLATRPSPELQELRNAQQQLDTRLQELHARLDRASRNDRGADRVGALTEETLAEEKGADRSITSGEIQQQLAQLESRLQQVESAESRIEAEKSLLGQETERVLENARKADLKGQMERWATREEERCEATIRIAGEELGLSWAHGERLAQCLRAENQQRRELMTELWGDATTPLSNEGYETAGEKWNYALERMKEARRHRDEELRRFLSEEQIQQLADIAKKKPETGG